MLSSRVMPTWNTVAAEYVANLVHAWSVATPLIVVSSALAARVRKELQSSAFTIILRLRLLASIVFNNNHGRSLSTLCVYKLLAIASSFMLCCFDTSTEASAPRSVFIVIVVLFKRDGP